jgi:hypothetical protein
MTKIWKKMSFWTKMKYTIGLVGTSGTVTLVLTHVPEWMPWVTGASTFLGAAISIWLEDKNSNGIVDAFEDNENPKP